MNLAMVLLQRGSPDRAEPRLRESIETFRRSGSRRLVFAQIYLAATLGDLGRREEATSALAEAIASLPALDGEDSLAYALRLRGDTELQSGQLAPAEATAIELEALAKSRGDRLPLGLSNRLRGEVAAARGDLAEAQRRFGDARRQLLENADSEETEELDVVWAESAIRFGELAAAREIASRVRPDPTATIETTRQFVAEAILARLDADEGRRDPPPAASKCSRRRPPAPPPYGDDSLCCGPVPPSRPQPEVPKRLVATWRRPATSLAARGGSSRCSSSSSTWQTSTSRRAERRKVLRRSKPSRARRSRWVSST